MIMIRNDDNSDNDNENNDDDNNNDNAKVWIWYTNRKKQTEQIYNGVYKSLQW